MLGTKRLKEVHRVFVVTMFAVGSIGRDGQRDPPRVGRSTTPMICSGETTTLTAGERQGTWNRRLAVFVRIWTVNFSVAKYRQHIMFPRLLALIDRYDKAPLEL